MADRYWLISLLVTPFQKIIQPINKKINISNLVGFPSSGLSTKFSFTSTQMRFILLISCLFLFACTTDNTSKKEVITVANTPEAVAQFWLETYYDNQFDVAKKYSTSETQIMIDTIKGVLFTEFEKSTSFKISALRCTTDSLQAACTYIYLENEEKIPEDIDLRNVDGRWLVDERLE